jgi:hypothetical protein
MPMPCPHFLYGRWLYGTTIPERVRDSTELGLAEAAIFMPLMFSRKVIV